jgi:hypothetical protein
MSTRDKLREYIFEERDHKEEFTLELNDEELTVFMEPVTYQELEQISRMANLRTLLQCAVNHLYDEDGNKIFDEDDVDHLCEQTHIENLITQLVDIFNEVNEFEAEVSV